MELVIQNLCKKYNNKVIFSNLNLVINGNEIFCLLGSNGAGKSTLLNIIADLIDKDLGIVKLDENIINPSSIDIKKIIGFQSQYNQLIEEFDAHSYLKLIGLLYGIEKPKLRAQIENLLNFFFDNSEDTFKEISTYSAGMKKKVAICASLIHKPKLLLLDEPFANLDPLASDRLCFLLKAYINEERMIIISSHDLLYVDKIATHLGVIFNGQFEFNGSIDKFKTYENVKIETQLLKYINHDSKDLTELISNII